MTDAPESPLHYILKEVVRAFDNRLYYAAIGLCLAIPDICAGLERDPQNDTRKFWDVQGGCTKWCADYLPLTETGGNLTPEDIWALRGGVIHRGQTFGHPKSRYRRVVFILPHPEGTQAQFIFKDSEPLPVCAMSVDVFCQDVLNGAQKWIEATKDNAIVQRNLEGLVRVRPEGYPPAFAGHMVIA